MHKIIISVVRCTVFMPTRAEDNSISLTNGVCPYFSFVATDGSNNYRARPEPSLCFLAPPAGGEHHGIGKACRLHEARGRDLLKRGHLASRAMNFTKKFLLYRGSFSQMQRAAMQAASYTSQQHGASSIVGE